LLAFTLGLAGCGGGGTAGGNGPIINGGMPGGDDKPFQTLSKIYQDATTNGKEHTFSTVLSASVLQNRDANQTSVPDSNELSVSSIVRNDGGGYDVTYLIDESSSMVTFLPSDCDAVEENCVSDLDQDGNRDFDVWAMHDTVEDSGILGPSAEAEYHNAKHFQVHEMTAEDENFLHKQIFVFGLTTPEENQPETGSATYHGWFFGYANRMTESGNEFRQRIRADMQLVANFDMSTTGINGELSRVRGQLPGQPGRIQTPWPNSRFEITGTGINSAGQFTATVKGIDDSQADDVESARGFMGELTAQLFGPKAEEIGGSVSLSRDLSGDENDLALYGHISGKQFGPAKMIGSAGISVGVNRNYADEETELQGKGMPTIMRNGSDSGWIVTVNENAFELYDSEYNRQEFLYFHARGGDAPADSGEYLWTQYGGFSKSPEFDYFDIKGWASNSQNEDIFSFVFIGHGDRTSISGLPTTSAIYNGNFEGRQFDANDAMNSGETTRYRGDLKLTADFASSTVAGEVTNLRTRVRDGNYNASQGGASFEANINGHDFSASDFAGRGELSGYQNGNVHGSFFGPSAEEAGGVFDARRSDDLLIGFFGTTREN